MTIQRGDCFELDLGSHRQLMKVVSIGFNWIQMQPLSFARPAMEKAERNAWLFVSGKKLISANPRKVRVSPIGEVIPINE
jgi:hypothetical protein